MTDYVTLVSTFVNAVALVMAMVLGISLLTRSDHPDWMTKTLMGVMFSLAVAYTMSNPFALPTGGVYDMRTLLIGAAVGLLGPLVGMMAFVTGLIFRWGIGGESAIVGMASIVLTCVSGALWWYTVHDRPWAMWQKTLLLGVMISSTAFAILLTPQQFWIPLATGLMPYIFVSNIIGCFMLNFLIRGEVSFAEAVVVSRRHASTDHLTGLLNRRGFDDAYAWMARGKLEKNRGLSLLFFDIDFFKDIDDTHGHAVGDAMLRHIADTVRDNLRPLDIFARLGGDEFAAVLHDIDARTAKVIAQRCCASIAAGQFTHDGNLISVSASTGGVWMLDKIELDRFIDEADQALYVAKQQGRNQVLFKSGIGDSSTHQGLALTA